MKNINLFNKVLSYICIILFLSIFTLFIFGKFNRVGYLSDLQFVSQENGIYNYNFRVSYYSKIFRNSDIYEVYINTNEVITNNNFIKEINFKEKGSPSGNLISYKEISEEKIDNIKYNLNIKFYMFIILIVSFILFLINPNSKEIIIYIISFFNKYKKLILKIYLILIFSVIFIFILLFLSSKVGHKGTLENFELIAESKAGYVYKAKLKSKGLFSPNFIYKYSDKALKLKDTPNYIKHYGYFIEINEIANVIHFDPYISPSFNNNEDGTFTVSNSIGYNIYTAYIIPLHIGEKYRVSVKAKRINGEGGNIRFTLDAANEAIYIDNTDNIGKEYNIYSKDIIIEHTLFNNYYPHVKYLTFYFPNGEINIKNIQVQELSEELYLKDKSYVIFTSDNVLNNDLVLDNVIYKVQLNLVNVIIYLLLISFLPLSIYVVLLLIFDINILINNYINIAKDIRYYFITIIIIFFCFLIMPNIIYKVFYDKFDHVNYENRVLSIRPVLDIKHLDKYPKEYEQYFNDYIPFRNEFVKLKNIIDINIFHNLLSKDLLLGKDKWLFLSWTPLVKDYIGNYEYSNDELKNAKDNLLKLEKRIRDKNIDFYLMICPDKNKIYPEYMPDYIKRIHPEYSAADSLVEYLKENTNIKIVYPKKELLKYKESDLLYYKYDAHWNRLGAYIGYIELMKAMNKDYFDLKDINIIRNDMGTSIFRLSHMISLSESKIYKYDTEYIISNFTSNNYKMVSNYNTTTSFQHFCSDSQDKRRVVILRDSFSEAMLDYISSNFYEVIFISIAFSDVNVLDYAIKLNPDIVVFQTVERFLKDRILYFIPYLK